LQAFRSKKHYFWVQSASKNSTWIIQNEKIKGFVELADDETLFF